MSFAAPAWLALLAAVLPGIVLLHARRRVDRPVASLLIWRRLRVDPPSGRTRRRIPWRDPLLWLHLAIAAFAVLALARPLAGPMRPQAHWIVLLDGSATMRAVDVEPSRHEAAKAEAVRRWTGSGRGGGPVTVVAVDADPTLVAARASRAGSLAQRLERLTPSDDAPAWRAAASLVRRTLRPGEDARVAILTDRSGAGRAVEALEALGIEAPVYLETYGAELVDVGIERVAASSRSGQRDRWLIEGDVTTSGLSAGDVVRVQAHFRPLEGDAFLPWGGTDVVLERGGRARFAFPLDLPGPGLLEVRGPGGDHLSANDAAVRWLDAGPGARRVGIVGDAPPALRRALTSIAGVELYRLDATPGADEAEAFELLVITEPADVVPATSTLWLGSVPDTFRADDAVPRPVLWNAAPDHVLMRDVDVPSIGVRDAVALRRPSGATPLMAGPDGTFAWARTTDRGRQVAVGFGLDASAWSSQVSFPAFVAALVEWATAGRPREEPCRAGRACALPRDAYAGAWSIRDPSGAVVARAAAMRDADDEAASAVWAPGSFDRAFVPEHAGFYRVRQDGRLISVLPVDASPVPRGAEPPAEPPIDLAAAPMVSRASPLPWRALAAAAALLALVDVAVALARRRRADRGARRPGRGPALAAVAVTLAASAWLAAALQLPVPAATWGGTLVRLVTGSAEGHGGPAWTDGLASLLRGWTTTRIDVASAGDAATATMGLRDATVAGAIELGLALPSTEAAHRLVVQGSEQVLDEAEGGRLLRRLAGSGVPVDVEASEAPPARADDAADAEGLRILEVDAPSEVRAGAGFDVTVAARTRSTSELRVRVEREDGSTAATASGDAGGPVTSVRVPMQAGAQGLARYRIVVEDASFDERVDGSLVVHVGPPIRALMVASDDAKGLALAEALASQEVTVERETPRRIPATLEALAEYDVVLLVDVPASDVHSVHQDLLARYVRDRGGGLVVFGGRRAFGPGGYFSTPLEEVSPLSARVQQDAPEVAMTFVLDRSGSMNAAVGDTTRMEIAKAATLQAVELLGEGSQAAVVVFDEASTVLIPMRPADRTELFARGLASVRAAGGTSLYPALLDAYRITAASPSATRHVVVLTDGLSQPADFASVLGELRALGVSASFVGIGDGADRGQLSSLAALGGGALHLTRDVRALPGILAQEAMMSSAEPIEERPVTPSWSEEPRPAFLDGVADERPPTLAGYVRTTAKDGASVHLLANREDDPLLASWRYGLGRVVAFASQADGPWTASWLERPEYPALWGQALRWTTATLPRDPWRFDARVVEAGIEVSLEVPEPSSSAARPVAFVTAEGGSAAADRRALLPDGAGRYVGRLGRPAVGEVWTVHLEPSPELGIDRALERTVVRPGGRGVLGDRPEPFGVELAWLAHVTGGRVSERATSADGLPFVGLRFRWAHAVGAWLGLALAAFLIGLAVRFGVRVRWPGRRSAATRDVGSGSAAS